MAEQRTVVDRSNSIQEALWQHAKVIVAKDNSMVPTGLFQTLNEMIDDQEKRLAAFRNRVPNVVPLGLFGIAAIAGGFAGYASGLDPKRNRLPVYTMGFLVSAVILLIFDLDRRGGLRPSLTAPARAALRGAGRDEGMGRPVEQRDAQEEASLPHYHRVRALDLTTVLNASFRRPVRSAATWPTFTSVQWPA
jgi:hypothetical protein